VLHIAPEAMFVKRLRNSTRRYISGDLKAEFGPDRLNVLDLQFPDETFDVVVCNHVLEHIGDDRRAMREISRVLRPDGWAILLVPDVTAAMTAETPGITDPNEMLKLYGQRDHVRRYGWDYVDRLAEAGLRAEVVCLDTILGPQTVSVCRLLKFGVVEPLFLVRRTRA
jgi:SAM-dependent methyltransferase